MGGTVQDKTVLISGSAGGQGEAQARLFVAQGARVVVADVREDAGRDVAADLGDAARFVPLDVTDAAAWDRAIDEAVDAFGRLDVLINNAGVWESAPIQDASDDLWERTIAVNQTGVFLGMRAAARRMIEQGGGGAIVNVGSIAAFFGLTGAAPYSASKAAVVGMTKSAAIDLGPHGIRVNVVHPGGVQSDMGHDLPLFARIPAGRIAQPDEVGQLILFLASDASSYVTGAEMVADGGWSAGMSRDQLL